MKTENGVVSIDTVKGRMSAPGWNGRGDGLMEVASVYNNVI